MVTKLGGILRKIFDLSDGNGGNSFSKVLAFVITVVCLVFIPLHVIQNSHEEMILLGLIGAAFGTNIAKALPSIFKKEANVPD